nr:hypothetical protein [Tanacetum cinerariifolium]
MVLKGLAVQKQLTKLNAINVARNVILQETGGQRFSSFISVTFQPKLLYSSKNKPEMRNTKDFEAKYNKVKAKLDLLEELSSDDEETKVKALMVLTNEETIFVGKENARNGKLTKITIKKVPSNKSQRNITNPLAIASDSLASNYDSADESLVCSTPILPLKKLDGAELSSGPKTVKSILKLKSTFKTETLKGITINEPSSAFSRGNKSSSAFKTNSAPTGKLKNVKMEYDPPVNERT